MSETPDNRNQEQLIHEVKRTRWQQKGGGEEYQYYAYRNDPVTRLKNITEISFVLRHAVGPKVLDAGAGTGRFTIPLIEKGFEAIGVDISREMLAQGIKHSERQGVPFSCLIGDIEKLPFPDETFDTVVSITVLRHFPGWQEILREYLRVVRPGGRVLFDIGSGDQRAYLAQRDWRRSPGPAAHDPLAFEVAMTRYELSRLAAQHNLRIVLTTPYDFFHVNDLLRYALGTDYDALESQLAETMNTHGALALCEAVTRGVFPYLSPALTSSWLIVLEKAGHTGEEAICAHDTSAAAAPTRSPAHDVMDVLRIHMGYKLDAVAADISRILLDPDARRFFEYCRAHILPRLPLESLSWEAKE